MFASPSLLSITHPSPFAQTNGPFDDDDCEEEELDPNCY